MKPKLLLAVGAVLVVLGVVLMIMPTPGEPDMTCAPEGTPPSGVIDPSQDDCMVTPESADEYSEWASGPRWDNIAGALLLVVGLGTGVVGLVGARRRTRDAV